ncbi:uncharacterized protein LOC127129408 isoform X2 [Lathyrus oleraceus]|uniref:uncharacterized protein LOC127129408 isoform X2 n=1 Tax=Pisum sativum TaxID=3888 RepID=UPI0021D2E4F2|nr:uncharacterized protein LOC127129408 isoform X2 [Pisum sativum]
MDSSTRPFWTDQKHVNYLNTMEAIFVRTMFQNKTSFSNHNRPILRLDRHLPDTSESTLDLKPHNRSHTRKYHAPSSAFPFYRFDWSNNEKNAEENISAVQFITRSGGPTCRQRKQRWL